MPLKHLSTNIKLSRARISKIIRSGEFLGKLALLSKLAAPLMKVAVPLAKNILAIRNNSFCFNNWCRNSKENTRFWNNNLNNLK